MLHATCLSGGAEHPPTGRDSDQAIGLEWSERLPDGCDAHSVSHREIPYRRELLTRQPFAGLDPFPQCCANSPVRRFSAARRHGADRR